MIWATYYKQNDCLLLALEYLRARRRKNLEQEMRMNKNSGVGLMELAQEYITGIIEEEREWMGR